MNTRPLYVGIDLGTSNSTVVLFDGKDLAVVRNRQGGVLTPSIVRIDGRGNVLVGDRAQRFLDVDPENTRSEFKRLMGTAHSFKFPASGSVPRPQELAAEVLKSLRQDVADQVGGAPRCAVISVPALFELHQTAAVSEAALGGLRARRAHTGAGRFRDCGGLEPGEQPRVVAGVRSGRR
jgi:molecular chaperone DnaK